MIKAKLEITANGKTIYEITYTFQNGQIQTQFGNLGNLENKNHALRILNILGNVHDFLGRQIRKLSKTLNVISKENETEIYS